MSNPNAMPIYISGQTPRLILQDEAALTEVTLGGLLEESHHIEVKGSVPLGKGANRELARDLSSFAIDGGCYIVGVEEDKETNTFKPVPLPLAGLSERIEQVARTLPDPPLAVLTQEIGSAQDPTKGYLIVHIPPSGLAPHMVDNKYLGRGHQTKHYLSDPEVRRLHEQRRATEQDGLSLLQHQFDRDPVPEYTRNQAHLFLLAEPIAGRSSMLLDLIHGAGSRDRLFKLVGHAAAPEITRILQAAGVGGFSPSISYATDIALRSTGIALTSRLNSNRTPATSGGQFDEKIVEVEIDEDGGLRIFMGRLSDNRNDPFADEPGTNQALMPSAAITYARQFVALITAAAEHASYLGPWTLAAGATGIQDLPVIDYLRHGDPSPRYDAPDYRRATTASYAELIKQPGAITDRLVGRLLRSLGMHQKYASALTDPQ